MALPLESFVMSLKRILKITIIIGFIVCLVIATRQISFADRIASFNMWVIGLGASGMIIFALTYAVATVLFLPGSLLTLAGGTVFGLGKGFVTVWLGATLGAALAFLTARFIVRKHVEAWIYQHSAFNKIDKGVAKEGWKVVLLTRLSPVFPFNFQNYGYGLTGVSFIHYILASWIGMAPGTFLYVYLGTIGRSGLDAITGARTPSILEIGVNAVGLIATLLATILVTRIAKQALREAGVSPQT